MLYFKVGMIFFISLYLCFWCWFRKRNPWVWNILTIIVMSSYVWDVLWITVMRGEYLEEQTKVLTPFYAYYKMMVTGWNGSGLYIAIALFGNTLLFVPLGMVFSQIFQEQYNLYLVMTVGLLCSMMIEWYQFSHYVGTFEMDDLIQNTWGAMIGCGIGNAVVTFRDKGKQETIKRNLAPLLLFALLLGTCSLISYLIWKI